MARVLIGCSGFNYAHWREVFYPSGLPQKAWLNHYCKVFRTVELNVTFYRLPKESTFERWYEQTPEGFIFAVKGSRYLTHVKRLSEPEGPLELFFRGALKLREKLGIVLWQFPPGFKSNPERLARFLDLLRAYPVRNAFEFRNETWIHEEVTALLGERNAALCFADWPPFASGLPLTSNFVYMRRHGAAGIYEGCYTPEFLRNDAESIAHDLSFGRDVYVYFNNDARGCAPRNARELMEIMHEARRPWKNAS